MKNIFLFILLSIYLVSASLILNNEKEERRLDLLIEIIKSNSKPRSGWNNVITYGSFPDYWYHKLKSFNYTHVNSNSKDEDYYFEEAVNYASNIIIIECFNFTDIDNNIHRVKNLPNFHPHANIILYYHREEEKEIIAKMFYALWYFKAPNAILFQFDDFNEVAKITDYNPYSGDTYDIAYKYGCWTAKTIGIPVHEFESDILCESSCRNVTVKTKLRGSNLGSCIGFATYVVNYNDSAAIYKLNILQDKGKNLHGYAMRTLATEVLPFIKIEVYDEEHFSLKARDGLVWNTLAEKMNFTMYLYDIVNVMKVKYNFQTNVQQIFSVAQRKADLFLIPIYQFDVAVVEIDYTFAYRASGVCFLSRRAEFETIFFDPKVLAQNLDIILQFIVIILGVWLVFTLYSCLEAKHVSFDLIGKNFMNTLRNILLINLWKPPNSGSFRLFLTITIWGFFVLNFSTQAAIISFFSAYKRGKEVDTFDDIVQKGYKIEGIPTPDTILPDTEEKFRIINSRLKSTDDLFMCMNKLRNDSHRFCLIECSVGQYVVRNKLNEKGQQYLHLAKDRIHSHYLNIMQYKYSPLTDYINKYMLAFFEAGLIMKWEQYRFNDIKEEALVKPLSFEDLKGVFNVYISCVVVTSIVFVIEVIFGNFKRIILYWKLKCRKFKTKLVLWTKRRLSKKQKKVFVSNSTQTEP